MYIFLLQDIADSVWSQVVGALNLSSPTINQEKIESFFKAEDFSKAKTSTPTTKKSQCSSFLDQKISLNLSVALKPFKKSPEDVAKLINDCNSSELDGERLKTLLKVLPDKEVVSV